MPSKEHEALVEKVARDLSTLNEGTEDTWENYHADAQKACSTILAALQEPTPAMQLVVSANWGRRTWAEYQQVLAASALGEQRDAG